MLTHIRVSGSERVNLILNVNSGLRYDIKQKSSQELSGVVVLGLLSSEVVGLGLLSSEVVGFRSNRTRT